MDFDLLLVVGVALLVLAGPSFLNAYSENRPPRTAILLALVGGGMLGYAAYTNPAGIELQDIPDAFLRVMARVLG